MLIPRIMKQDVYRERVTAMLPTSFSGSANANRISIRAEIKTEASPEYLEALREADLLVRDFLARKSNREAAV